VYSGQDLQVATGLHLVPGKEWVQLCAVLPCWGTTLYRCSTSVKWPWSAIPAQHSVPSFSQTVTTGAMWLFSALQLKKVKASSTTFATSSGSNSAPALQHCPSLLLPLLWAFRTL